jgi:group II intron reverse transcriptase/maturase
MAAQQLQFEFKGGRISVPRGEAPEEKVPVRQVMVTSGTAEPAVGVTMEEVVERQNLQRALKRVCANQGSPGVDDMTVDQLKYHLRIHWPEIRQRLLNGQYTPEPVKQVLIPKPDGSSRALGIPTVVDRFVQQALLQALTPMYDPGFSAHSFGFRPGRNAHQAVRQAKEYIAQGHEWVVDIDLEKCFDRINHDILMGRLARRISDKRILRLIRRYLQAGVMVNGVVQERYEGTPQGGPLSPLLSNILLDELDQELQRRGHKFCRYADDCNIYVHSERSGKRVMETIEGFCGRGSSLRSTGKRARWPGPRRGSFWGSASPRIGG